jgi:hypothetical protein
MYSTTGFDWTVWLMLSRVAGVMAEALLLVSSWGLALRFTPLGRFFHWQGAPTD